MNASLVRPVFTSVVHRNMVSGVATTTAPGSTSPSATNPTSPFQFMSMWTLGCRYPPARITEEKRDANVRRGGSTVVAGVAWMWRGAVRVCMQCTRTGRGRRDSPAQGGKETRPRTRGQRRGACLPLPDATPSKTSSGAPCAHKHVVGARHTGQWRTPAHLNGQVWRWHTGDRQGVEPTIKHHQPHSDSPFSLNHRSKSLASPGVRVLMYHWLLGSGTSLAAAGAARAARHAAATAKARPRMVEGSVVYFD